MIINDNSMKIRNVIENRMKRLGIKNRALCEDLKIIEQNFSAYLNGRRTIPHEDLEKVCMYLGLTLADKE